MHADGPGSGMVPLGPKESYAVRTGTPGWQRDKSQHLSTWLQTSAEAQQRLEMGAGRMNSQPGFAHHAIFLTENTVSGLGRSSVRVCLSYFSTAGRKYQAHDNYGRGHLVFQSRSGGAHPKEHTDSIKATSRFFPNRFILWRVGRGGGGEGMSTHN